MATSFSIFLSRVLSCSLWHIEPHVSSRESGRGVSVQGVLGPLSMSGVTACRSTSSAFAQDSVGPLGGTEEGWCGSDPYEFIRVGTQRGGEPQKLP